jgi:hypothetical protein
MPLTEEQRNELTKHGTEFHAEVVLCIDAMAISIKTLEARIKILEAREPAKKLRVVNDG